MSRGIIGSQWGKLWESGGATILSTQLLNFFLINILQFLNGIAFQWVTHWLRMGYSRLLVEIHSYYNSLSPNCVKYLK